MLAGGQRVYNFRVEELACYVVGSLQILVHNTSKGNQRSDEFKGDTDAEIRKFYDCAQGERRKKLEKELKARGLKNVRKRIRNKGKGKGKK